MGRLGNATEIGLWNAGVIAVEEWVLREDEVLGVFDWVWDIEGVIYYWLSFKKLKYDDKWKLPSLGFD